MSFRTLRLLIRETMLNEIDRYKAETGKDFNALKTRGLDLRSMANDEIAPGVPRYYFNMSDDFKPAGSDSAVTPMAIFNPKAEYNTTPIGFYAYPLNEEYLGRLIGNNLPYLSTSSWVTIIEAASASGLLYLGNDDDREIYESIKELANRNSTHQARLLRERNYTWVYDPGTGTIYPEEATQVVFLRSSAYKAIERFNIKDLGEGFIEDTASEVSSRPASSMYWMSQSEKIGLARFSTDPKALSALVDNLSEIKSKSDNYHSNPAGALSRALLSNKRLPFDRIADVIKFMTHDHATLLVFTKLLSRDDIPRNYQKEILSLMKDDYILVLMNEFDTKIPRMQEIYEDLTDHENASIRSYAKLMTGVGDTASDEELISLLAQLDRSELNKILEKDISSRVFLSILMNFHGDLYTDVSKKITADMAPYLVENPSKSVRRWLALSPEVPSSIIDTLVKDPEPAIRAAAARSPQISRDALLEIVKDPEITVRFDALSNPTMPNDVFVQILKSLKVGDEHYFSQAFRALLTDEFGGREITDEMWNLGLEHMGPALHTWIAQSKKTPIEILKKMANEDPFPKARDWAKETLKGKHLQSAPIQAAFESLIRQFVRTL